MVQLSNDALGDRISSLAAHIDAALCEWLELVAEFDRREAWAEWGMSSCAHWLAWTCSLSLRTAREHVRVAGRLAAFPLTAAAFRRGELSYSKVRAVTRVEDVSREAELVDLARAASAAQLDRIVRAYARCVEVERPDVRRRFVSLDPDDDGTWVLRGRLGAEEAAVVQEALGRFAEFERGSAEPPEDAESAPTVGERTADALVAMAGRAVAGGSGPARRPEVTVLVDVEALAAEDSAPGRSELEGGTPLATETARRLCCDAGIVVSTHRNGKVLDVGRRRRTISPALQRALRARDGCCQFPGCTNHRFVDAHHIKHWARGGDTSLENLVLLCGHHHRLVHEGGFTLERARDGAVVVLTPSRRRIAAVPRNRRGDCTQVVRTNRRRGLEPAARSLLPTDGGPFDLDLAVDAMLWFTRPPDQASGP
jgi:Domain of unknown function (DUF222)/HNH endonuclease